ncbi:MAG: hypothetical protein ABIT06_01270 [Saprospiraceae bacterium]
MDSAEILVLEELKTRPDNIDLLTHLGVINAKKGNKTKANEIISKLESLKEKYDLGVTPYFQGRIKSVLGEYESAIQYLSKALDEGITFQVGTTFHHDPDLIMMKNDKAFQELLIRNRYQGN